MLVDTRLAQCVPVVGGVLVAVDADEVVSLQVVDDVLELGEIDLGRVRLFEAVDDGVESLNDSVLALDVDSVDDSALALVGLVRRCPENVQAADHVGDVLGRCDHTLDLSYSVIGPNVPLTVSREWKLTIALALRFATMS